MSYEVVDFATGLPVLIKQPSESRKYRLDFSNLLEGALLSSITSITAENQGKVGGSSNVVLSEQAVDQTGVTVRIAGGTAGEQYKITAIVEDGDGNILEGEGMLYVREL